MVVPAEREGLSHDASQPIYGNSETSLVSSRKAGGRQDIAVGHSVCYNLMYFILITIKVIVDMREFRSSLPSLLHKRGISVIPITLEVNCLKC